MNISKRLVMWFPPSNVWRWERAKRFAHLEFATQAAILGYRRNGNSSLTDGGSDYNVRSYPTIAFMVRTWRPNCAFPVTWIWVAADEGSIPFVKTRQAIS